MWEPAIVEFHREESTSLYRAGSEIHEPAALQELWHQQVQNEITATETGSNNR